MTDPLEHDYVREPLGDIWGWVLAAGAAVLFVFLILPITATPRIRIRRVTTRRTPRATRRHVYRRAPRVLVRNLSSQLRTSTAARADDINSVSTA